MSQSSTSSSSSGYRSSDSPLPDNTTTITHEREADIKTNPIKPNWSRKQLLKDHIERCYEQRYETYLNHCNHDPEDVATWQQELFGDWSWEEAGQGVRLPRSPEVGPRDEALPPAPLFTMNMPSSEEQQAIRASLYRSNGRRRASPDVVDAVVAKFSKNKDDEVADSSPRPKALTEQPWKRPTPAPFRVGKNKVRVRPRPRASPEVINDVLAKLIKAKMKKQSQDADARLTAQSFRDSAIHLSDAVSRKGSNATLWDENGQSISEGRLPKDMSESDDDDDDDDDSDSVVTLVCPSSSSAPRPRASPWDFDTQAASWQTGWTFGGQS